MTTLFLGLLPALVLAAPVTYSIDPEATEIVAFLSPAGLLRGASHPHVIAARQVAGEMVYDAENPERSSVRLRLPADALENDDPALRKKYGLEGTLDDGDRKKVAAGMRSEDQLDTAHFPTIAFASIAVRRLDGGELEVAGRLTIRGVSARISLPVRVALGDGVLRGEGTVRITHAMFELEPYSTALGTIRNAEEIVLRVTLVGRARAEPADGGSAPDGGPAPDGGS